MVNLKKNFMNQGKYKEQTEFELIVVIFVSIFRFMNDAQLIIYKIQERNCNLLLF